MLKGWRPYFILFVLGFALFGQTLFFDFTYFDDQSLILDNAPILSNYRNIPELFINDVFFSAPKFYYRPLLNLSFMADMKIGGVIPFFYHLDNILIHILAASLLYLFFIKLKYRRELALLFAAIFVVHPALTQAVAWVPGRNDSLLAVFVLVAFHLFLAFQESPRLRYYLGYLAFFFLALLTKETAAALPAIIIFYFLIVEPKKTQPRDRFLLIFGSLAIGFIWYLLRKYALGTDSIALSNIITSIWHNAPALLISWGKFLFPVNLKVLPILEDNSLIYGLITLPLFFLVIYFSKQKRWRQIAFGFVWFFLFLLPSLVRPNLIGTPDFLEHRLYLPVIGLFIILAELDWLKKINFQKKEVWLGVLAVIFILFGLSWRHLPAFENRLSFWKAAANSSPHSALAQRNLGAMYYLDNNLVEAEKYYWRALALNENEPMAHNNLGLIYEENGDYPAAEREYLKELSLYPNYDKTLLNLGNLYYKEKKLTDSGNLWRAALQANPYNYEAYQRLLILANQLR